MARHLCYMAESNKNKKIVKTISNLIGNGKKPAKFFSDILGMSSRQASRFLKRIDEVERSKKYNQYEYFVDISTPKKIAYGDEWIKVEELSKSKLKITTSQGDEKIVKK